VITICKPFDAHLHVRDGEMLSRVALFSAAHFDAGVIMPNLTPPVRTREDACRYRERICSALEDELFTPHMTIYLTDETTPRIVEEADVAGVVAVKYYPKAKGGHLATTNSGHGVLLTDLPKFQRVFRAMEERGMVLCLHGEDPDEPDHLRREAAFLPHLESLARAHPRLKIVLEHVSSREGVAMVMSLPNLAATITAHHLVLTKEDWQSGNHHHLCMPVAKTSEDRDVLWKAIGHPRFFFGSDSAPHDPRTKVGPTPSYGVFSAPVALPLLAMVFHDRGILEVLEAFTSFNGPDWYGLARSDVSVSLERLPWTVPVEYNGIVPLWAGQTITWSVAG